MKVAWGIMVVVMLGACGFTGDTTDAGEDVLVVNNMSDARTLDPGLMSGAEEQRIALALFEGLAVSHPKTLEALPGMAERWQESADGTVWDFYLRDAQWSDGKPVLATDFLYAWRRVLTPAGHPHGGAESWHRYFISSPYVDILYVIRNARAWHRGELSNFSDVGIEVVSERQLRVTLERPTPWFLELLTFPTFYPVPQHVVEEQKKDWTRPKNIIGNGPFVLAERRQGNLLKVTKSETYWDRDQVGLEGLVYLSTDQVDTAIDQYLAGESDWVRSFNPKKVRAWKNDDELKAHLRSPEFLATFFFRLNMKSPVMEDPRIRRALSLAIDREAMTTYVTGLGETPAKGLVPLVVDAKGAWRKAARSGLAFDPEQARILLREAGYPNGKGLPPLQIAFNTDIKNRAIAEAVQQMWAKELGVEVILENREKRVHFAKERGGDYMISRGNWIGDYSDPTTFLDVFRSDAGSNRTGWKNKRYDELLDKALKEPSETKRLALLAEAEHIVCVEDPAIIPVFHYKNAYLLRPGKYDGLFENSRNIHPPKFIKVKKP